MSSVLKQFSNSIALAIQFHPAWLGHVSGLKAEKLLRGRNTSYLYILRKGEEEIDYYVTFVDGNNIIRHQPFQLTETIEGWYYENGGPKTGPNCETDIENIIHKIMHCEKEECTPFDSSDKRWQ